MDLQGKKIALLGFGLENQAVLEWLIGHKFFNITICDKNPKIQETITKQISKSKLQIPNLPRRVKAGKFQIRNIKFQTGKDYLKNLKEFDVIFRTPGISYLTPEIQQAKRAGVEIISQTKLFFDLCPAKIIGVTGTKGKGTTTALISEILKRNNQTPNTKHQTSIKAQKPKSETNSQLTIHNSQFYIGGNIGNPPIEFVDKLIKDDWVVLELSSFQLQDLERSPHIAVILDIKEDHLDYHRNRKEYIDAKTNIVQYQNKKDFTVINLDYLTSFKFALLSPTENDWYFSRRKSVDLGTFIKWDNKNEADGWIILRNEEKDWNICRVSEVTLRGKHNLENICAAIATSFLAGASIQSIQREVPKFKGLEHRLEFVKEVKKVKFYDDSFSTNPDTTIAAIRSFNEPIILIVGGSEKGADYSNLAKEITESSIKTIIAIGVTGPKIIKSLKHLNIKTFEHIKIIEGLKDMREIVKTVYQEANPGDIVLLSPASASFDMFKNYKDRGEQFKSAVADL